MFTAVVNEWTRFVCLTARSRKRTHINQSIARWKARIKQVLSSTTYATYTYAYYYSPVLIKAIQYSRIRPIPPLRNSKTRKQTDRHRDLHIDITHTYTAPGKLRPVCAARSIKKKDRTDRRTDRRMPDRYITLTARRGQRNNSMSR